MGAFYQIIWYDMFNRLILIVVELIGVNRRIHCLRNVNNGNLQTGVTGAMIGFPQVVASIRCNQD